MAVYEGPIFDVDVHHHWIHDVEVTKYLPARWREYLERGGLLSPPVHSGVSSPHGGRIIETYGPDKTKLGTEYDIMKRLHLDKHSFHRVLLTHNLGQYAGHLNQYFSAALCRAVNDWNIDTWLDRDDRFVSEVVIPLGAPEEAAKEIRRVGRHPRLVAVKFAGNVIGLPFGDPIYDPIYAAAAETGLAISIHYGGFDRPGTRTTVAGGKPGTQIGLVSQFAGGAMHYLSSYITHGVFEKFPTLRVLIQEYGTAWLPYALMRLDENYETLRLESPWVKKWPSEYVHGHIKLSTQPLEEGPARASLVDLFRSVDGIEDLLCFSTDWPHYSADDPEFVARLLPREWHRKVFCDNACEIFGIAKPVEPARERVAQA